MKQLKAISLFSGAMGLDLGIEAAGFDIRACVEYDKLAVETIRLNTSIPVIDQDINLVSTSQLLKVAGLKVGEVDLVFGGPPCQAFSTAGARRSLDDFRGNVISNFLRIVSEVKPKAFLLENVRGLLSSSLNSVPEQYSEYDNLAEEPGSVMYFLFQEFQKLGYKVTFALFDSANYGVPQRRERVLVFGSRLGTEVCLPEITHTENAVSGGKSWVTLREALKGLREQEMKYVEFRDCHKKYLKKLKAGQYWKHLSLKDQKEALGKSFYLGGGKTGFYRRLSWSKPSPTLVTTPVMPATMLCHPDKLRPLSIQEYARIQQFPDSWTFAGSTLKIYKQIGNAVPVGLGRAAGQALYSHLIGETTTNEKVLKFSRYIGTDHLSFISGFINRSVPEPTRL
jgi:DNA (cytosine-5)-methyltransferase 1